MNQIRKPVLLYAHLLLSSIGLLGVVVLIVRHIQILVPGSSFQTQLLYPWAGVFEATKMRSLAVYFGGTLSIAAFYLIAYWGLKAKRESILRQPVFMWLSGSWAILLTYLLVIAGLNVGLFAWADHGHLLLPMIVPLWIVAMCLPVLPANRFFEAPREMPKLSRPSFFLMVAMGMLAILPVIPFLSGGLPVENEFPDIPEKTILTDRHIVSNTEFINEHQVGGLIRYDPYKDGGENPPLLNQRGVHVPLTDLLRNWLSLEDRPARIFYDSRIQLLIPLRLYPDEYRQLENLLSPRQLAELNRKFLYSAQPQQAAELDGKFPYSAPLARNQDAAQIWDFVRRNESEFKAQSVAGHFFHHHYALAGPISDYLLGRPVEGIHFLYGWLNTIILSNMIKFLGGFSFEHYLQATYVFYPLYFFLALGVTAFLFRDKRYVFAMGTCALLALYAMGFEDLRFAPGLNPIRHFADIFLLLFLHRYWSGRGLRYLVIALGIGIFSILMNREFGVILFISALAASILHAATFKRWGPILILVAAGIAGVTAALYLPGNPYSTVKYVLMGVSVTSTSIVINFILGIALSLLGLLLLSAKERSPDWYALLFWAAYFAGLLAYFVWNPIPNHLLSLGVVWALLALLFIRQVSLVLEKPGLEINLVRVLIVASLVGLIPFVAMYWKDRHDYLYTFQTHITHKWDFTTASFRTTMDPKPFKESIALISKYAPGPEIVLISKYVSVMPWLAGKYNSIPYHELPLELLTLKEVNVTVDYLNARKPQYLFVDTDIWRSQAGDIFDFADPVTKYLGVWGVSRDRALLTQNLQLVAQPVLTGYKIIEVGPLLSVYERNADGVTLVPQLPSSVLNNAIQ